MKKIEKDLRELKEKTFLEGLKLLGLTKEDFKITIDDDTRVGLPQSAIIDLDCTCINVDSAFEEEKKVFITFTLTDNIDESEESLYNIDDLLNKHGYWHFEEIKEK